MSLSLLQKVLGESTGLMLGCDLEAFIQQARDYKKEYGDSFVSLKHLVLGFIQDQRFRKQILKEFQISKLSLKSAIEAIRGRQSLKYSSFNILCFSFTFYIWFLLFGIKATLM
jgi:ATP-dependent Clp protease ATP-binding subunit ClpA